MTRSPTIVLLAALAAAAPSAATAESLSARAIMERVDARDDGDNQTGRMRMTLIDRSGHERVRLLRSFRKDKGRDRLNLMFFLEPADVRDTGFLTYDYRAPERDDDQWLYLPELRKTKRIAGADKSSSFMGTDFSYADMTRRAVEEWRYRLLKEDKLRGHKVWLIEAVPASRAVAERYGYAKSVVFVRQDIFMVVRAVHWLADGGRLKYLDVTALEKIDGVWVATARDMRTVRGGRTEHRTVLALDDVRFGQDLDESLFTLRRLEQGARTR